MQKPTGLVLSVSEMRSRQEIIDFTRRAEDLGYDAIWLAETWGREMFTGLTHMACHTSRIKLAAGIVSVYSRTPALVAQSVASLDEISGGRVILGLGASSERMIQDWHGVPFDRPLQRSREFIEIVNRILSGERANYEGQVFRLKGFALQFVPPRRHIPIHLAALGPKNVELAGEVADGWMPVYVDPSYMPAFKARLQTGAQRAGRRLEDIAIGPRILTCALRDAERARQLVRAGLALVVASYGHFYYDLVVRYGFGEEAARIRELWKTDRTSIADGVSDAMVNAMAIAGAPGACRERFEQLRFECGFTSPSVILPHGAPKDAVQETVEAMAPGRG